MESVVRMILEDSIRRDIRPEVSVTLFVHRDLNIDFEQVVDEFSRKNSKLNFNRIKF